MASTKRLWKLLQDGYTYYSPENGISDEVFLKFIADGDFSVHTSVADFIPWIEKHAGIRILDVSEA